MESFLFSVLVLAMVAALFSIATHVYTLIALRRLGIHVPGYLSGIPGVISRRCATLPSSPNVSRLARISRWSDIAFAVAMFGGVISGTLLASHG